VNTGERKSEDEGEERLGNRRLAERENKRTPERLSKGEQTKQSSKRGKDRASMERTPAHVVVDMSMEWMVRRVPGPQACRLQQREEHLETSFE